MNNVVLNDAMEDVAANEAKFTIDGRSGTLNESPVVGLVVRSILVGVVKVSDRNYNKSAREFSKVESWESYRSSGSSTGKAGHMQAER
jgi:hypothetical protein